jgi:hypothetical protein
MKRTIICAVALSILAMTPACAAVITSEGVEGPYSHLEYSAAADGKDFLVEVAGVPFPGMTQEAFNDALMQVLQAVRPSHPAARFTTHPASGNADTAYRLVLVFGPARNLSFHTQCKGIDRARFEPAAAGTVKVSATFCRKDDLMSRATARTSATGVDDPAFRQMFAELLPVLFPLRNPYIDGQGKGGGLRRQR